MEVSLPRSLASPRFEKGKVVPWIVLRHETGRKTGTSGIITDLVQSVRNKTDIYRNQVRLEYFFSFLLSPRKRRVQECALAERCLTANL